MLSEAGEAHTKENFAHSSANNRLDWVKIAVIGIMCMAQTFPYYLVNSTVPTIFRAEGLELESFWAFSLLTIPAWAKILWAPLIDRYGWVSFGRRKSWILVCTFLGALSVWALAFSPPFVNTLPIVIGLLLVHMTIMATQDIAVDAYTLENLDEHERGAGSAFKVFSEAVGEALALGGLMYVYTQVTFPGQDTGWITMLLVSGLLLIIFTSPVIIRREPPMEADIVARRASGDQPRLSKFFKRRETPAISGLLLIGGYINFMMPPLLGALLVDKGFTLLEVGVIMAVVTPIAAPLGAISGGALITRIGLRPMLLVQAIFSGVAGFWFLSAVASGFAPPPGFSMISDIVTQAFPDWEAGAKATYTVIVLIPFGWGLAMLHMIYTVSRMGWASRTQAGTDFTIQGAMYNIGRTAAVASAPFIAAWFGWTGFVIAMTILMVGISAIYFVTRPRLEQMLDARRVSEGELTSDA